MFLASFLAPAVRDSTAAELGALGIVGGPPSEHQGNRMNPAVPVPQLNRAK
jgi:hypothetical protein